DPQVIGRFVDVAATPDKVIVYCAGHVVARHQRSWARHAVITDPAHRDTAATMRRALAHDRDSRREAERRHLDGHPVTLRALPDYDALFGVDFTPTPSPGNSPDGPAEEASSS
ncbi:IS21 family transposase, partial [Pseudonocardia sp. EV170527-09]